MDCLVDPGGFYRFSNILISIFVFCLVKFSIAVFLSCIILQFEEEKKGRLRTSKTNGGGGGGGGG